MIEMLPASVLLAIVATIGIKALALDLQLRQRAQFETRLRETLSFAMDRWQVRAGSVVLCDLRAGAGWVIVDYPAEAWIPKGAVGDRWIAWKQRLKPGSPDSVTAIAYRTNGMHEWRDWIYTVDWQLPVEDENAFTQAQPS